MRPREGKLSATRCRAPAEKRSLPLPSGCSRLPKERMAKAGGRVPPSGPQRAPNKALTLVANISLPKLIRARLSASLVRAASPLRAAQGALGWHPSSGRAAAGGAHRLSMGGGNASTCWEHTCAPRPGFAGGTAVLRAGFVVAPCCWVGA